MRTLAAAALCMFIAGPAAAQQALRAQDLPGVARPGEGINRKAGAVSPAEMKARQAQAQADRDNRQREIDERIKAGETEVAAIRAQAAGEMRDLTPAETRRVTEIETRIANAKEQRAKVNAALDEGQERMAEAERRARMKAGERMDDRRRAAGLQGRGLRRR